MFCPRCGAGVPAGHSECNACGNRLPAHPDTPDRAAVRPGDARRPVDGLGGAQPRW